MAIEKSAKIQILSQSAIITIFIFMLATFVTPAIDANNIEIDENAQRIERIKLSIAEIDIEEIDEKLNSIDMQLDSIDLKLNKIVLGMCGEFGGTYCE